MPDSLSADVAVVNLFAGALVEQSARLTEMTKDSGSLAISGMLKHQVGQAQACYRDSFEISARFREDWAILEMQKY